MFVPFCVCTGSPIRSCSARQASAEEQSSTDGPQLFPTRPFLSSSLHWLTPSAPPHPFALHFSCPLFLHSAFFSAPRPSIHAIIIPHTRPCSLFSVYYIRNLFKPLLPFPFDFFLSGHCGFLFPDTRTPAFYSLFAIFLTFSSPGSLFFTISCLFTPVSFSFSPLSNIEVVDTLHTCSFYYIFVFLYFNYFLLSKRQMTIFFSLCLS